MGSAPYRGILPTDNAEHLFGRNDEIRTIWQFLAGDGQGEHRLGRLLELTGRSGVGKSSVLRAGVAPLFHRQGWTVVQCRTWTDLDAVGKLVRGGTSGDSGDEQDDGATDSADSESSSAWRDVRRWQDAEQLAECQLPDAGSSDGKWLVILDQLEELYLMSPGLARRLVAEACRQVHELDLSVILSFRPEVRTEITDQVESTLPYRRFLYVPLQPLDEPAAQAIIRPTGSGGSETGGYLGDSDARVLAAAWGEAQPASAEDGVESGEVSLLHLQAALVNLWERNRNAPELSESERKDLSGEAAEKKVAFFRTALVEYLARELGWIAASLALQGRDGQALKDRPEKLEDRLTVATEARILPLLSSAGFKVSRLTIDLGQLVLPKFRELGLGRIRLASMLKDAELKAIDPSLFRKSFREVFDSASEAAPDSEAESGVDTSTLRLAMTFERALRELENFGVIRIIGSGNRRMVTLVHDGLGPAGKVWSDSVLNDPQVPIDCIEPVTGEQVLGDVLVLNLNLDAEVSGQSGGEGWSDRPFREPRPVISSEEYGYGEEETISGVQWLGCQITAHFKHVKFVECDFTGSVFNKSVFEGAVFTRCDFRGALFLECEFRAGGSKVPLTIDHSELRTLTMLRSAAVQSQPSEEYVTLDSSALVGDLVFSNLTGYGLFLEKVNARLLLQDCELHHVSLGGVDTLKQLRIQVLTGVNLDLLRVADDQSVAVKRGKVRQ